MFKTKLLILLLVSSIFFSCSSNQIVSFDKKYSLGYIPGEYDGLTFANLLRNNLKNIQAFDKNSELVITGEIKHTENLFITNINNTSDREKITSSIKINIEDKGGKCLSFSYNNQVSQFYIFSSSDKFLSNVLAQKKIKNQNTEILVDKFINEVIYKEKFCKEIK